MAWAGCKNGWLKGNKEINGRPTRKRDKKGRHR
jgi:hypothetical protein